MKCSSCSATAKLFAFKNGKTVYSCSKHASGKGIKIDFAVAWQRLPKVTWEGEE